MRKIFAQRSLDIKQQIGSLRVTRDTQCNATLQNLLIRLDIGFTCNFHNLTEIKRVESGVYCAEQFNNCVPLWHPLQSVCVCGF